MTGQSPAPAAGGGEPVDVIQIGVGGFGRRWVEAIRQSPRARCVGIVDVNPDALAPAGEALGVPPERRFAELSPALELDFQAAVVCIPPAARMPVYEALARAGKAIVCEKPLAGSMEDALAAARLAAEWGIDFVVSQNYRYFDAVQTLKGVLASGRLGRPVVAHAEFFRSPRFFGFREQMPYPLIIDMSIHHFDLARYLLGADPLRVTGASWNPPWSVMAGDSAAALAFEMSGQKRFIYNGSWSTLRPPERHTPWPGNWFIECEHGCAWMIDEKVGIAHWSLDEAGQPDWEPPDEVELVPRVPDGQMHVLHQLLDQMAGGPPAPTTVADNVKSAAMVFGALRAFREKAAVEVAAMFSPRPRGG